MRSEQNERRCVTSEAGYRATAKKASRKYLNSAEKEKR